MQIKTGITLIDKLEEKERKEFIEPLREQVVKSILNLRSPFKPDGFYFNPESKAVYKDGKKQGGNGVTTIKEPFIENLLKLGWQKEFPSIASEAERITKISTLKNVGKSKDLIYGHVVSFSREEEKVVIKDRKGNTQEYLLYSDCETSEPDDQLVGKLVSMKIAKPGGLDVCRTADNKLFAVEWETGNISSSHRALNKMAVMLLNGYITAGILIVPTKRMYPYLTDRIGNYEELKPYFTLWQSLKIDKGFLEIIPIEHDGLHDDAPILKKGKDGNAKKPVVVDPSNGSGHTANQMQLFLLDENK
ncbi:hypothetical protein L2D08_23235 [Domibacillus sp. PGB-M46]|uniref:hypothetical protein n=1 Tax=Domibacillus sp. PGB-M46 TaxID=2910255 RepID=UPI001F58D001|nr:hypothetical protein [Domibacillus sp. PGB-M46]MCI2257229.1 hypothetical protein [Domibacillus sp. PGB-M46]